MPAIAHHPKAAVSATRKAKRWGEKQGTKDGAARKS
jgi:hypothetical protein